jgi:hypothetical protein
MKREVGKKEMNLEKERLEELRKVRKERRNKKRNYVMEVM